MAERSPGRVVRLSVPIAGGESITVAARMLMHEGAAVGLELAAPAPGPVDPRERAARALVAHVAGLLRRPDGPGLAQLQQEGELLVQLLEQLLDLEAVLGRERVPL